MKNGLKILLSSLVSLTFMLSVSSVGFADGDNNVTQSQKDLIMEKYKMSQAFVDDLSEEQLKEYMDNIDQLVGVEKKEEYYRYDYDMSDPLNPKRVNVEKTTKEVATLSLMQDSYPPLSRAASCGIKPGYDCYKTSWLKLETWVYKYGTNDGSVQARFEWLKQKPTRTDEDIFAIGLNANMSPTVGTEKGNYKFDYFMPNGSIITGETKILSNPRRGAGGYAYRINLDDGVQSVNHRGWMTYKFSPNLSTLIVADGYSHYAHQDQTWSISPSISIPAGGGLELSSEKEFMIVTGHAQRKPW